MVARFFGASCGPNRPCAIIRTATAKSGICKTRARVAPAQEAAEQRASAAGLRRGAAPVGAWRAARVVGAFGRRPQSDRTPLTSNCRSILLPSGKRERGRGRPSRPPIVNSRADSIAPRLRLLRLAEDRASSPRASCSLRAGRGRRSRARPAASVTRSVTVAGPTRGGSGRNLVLRRARPGVRLRLGRQPAKKVRRRARARRKPQHLGTLGSSPAARRREHSEILTVGLQSDGRCLQTEQTSAVSPPRAGAAVRVPRPRGGNMW